MAPPPAAPRQTSLAPSRTDHMPVPEGKPAGRPQPFDSAGTTGNNRSHWR